MPGFPADFVWMRLTVSGAISPSKRRSSSRLVSFNPSDGSSTLTAPFATRIADCFAPT